MADEERPEEVQRWTAKRRAALIISLLKGETTAVEAARRHGLKVVEVEGVARSLPAPGRRTHCVLGRRKTRRCAKKGLQSAQAQGWRADHGPGHSVRSGQAAPYDVRRVIATLPGDRCAERVEFLRIFPCPAAGARGNYCGTSAARRSPGGTHSTVDRSASDIRLPAALGNVAFRRGDPHKPQGSVSIADAQGLV